MSNRSSRLPRASNQLAKLVVDTATGTKEADPPSVKSSTAVELGRLGGGKARAAKKAAAARWKR